jgi:hypothetical protein
MQIALRELLLEHHGNVEVDNIQEYTIDECKLSFPQLRECLYLLGRILYEDIENEVYVAYIRAGFGNFSGATVAMQLRGGELKAVGCAKEGVIKQRICETALQKLKSAALGEKVTDSSKFTRRFTMVLTLTTIAVLVFVRGCLFDRVDSDKVIDNLPISSATTSELPASGDESDKESAEEIAFKKEVQETVEATKAYNKAVEQFNHAVNEYNEAVTLTCLDNISGIPISLETLAIESESYEDVAEAIKNANSKEIIETDTNTVLKMVQQVKELLAIVKQITVPTYEWVENRLNKVDGVTGTQAVTANNDPEGLLGKEGGYTDCVYFTVKEISASAVPGKNIVEKGTDAGGAVEVYASLEEARARCDYLGGFDGTVLYSGSYAIVGTMVIRTSYKLTNQQQIDLTSAIATAMVE